MPWLIKQLKKAENCLTRKEARKVLKKFEKLEGHPYMKPNDNADKDSNH